MYFKNELCNICDKKKYLTTWVRWSFGRILQNL